MFNLELLWRVAKGAVSAATYRTAVSLLWPLPLSSGIIIAVLRPKPPGSLWGGASGEEPPGSLRESLGKIPAPGGLREPPGSFRDPPGPGTNGPGSPTPPPSSLFPNRARQSVTPRPVTAHENKTSSSATVKLVRSQSLTSSTNVGRRSSSNGGADGKVWSSIELGAESGVDAKLVMHSSETTQPFCLPLPLPLRGCCV